MRSHDPADDKFVEDGQGYMVCDRPLDSFLIEGMRTLAIVQAEYLLEAHGLRVDTFSRFKLNRACAIILQRAGVILARSAETGEPVAFDCAAERVERGEVNTPPSSTMPWRGAANAAPKPHQEAQASEPQLSLTSLLAGWWQEARAGGRKGSTYESYSNTLLGFIEFIGHDDARRIDGSDVVAFKNYRLTTPSKRTGKIPMAKTVKDSDLAALKTIFGWAVSNRKLATNPAAGITIKLAKPQRLRPKGFRDDEARALLSAALRQESTRDAPKTQAAKRWVPWLCAFTGARVGEMAQLRREDVRQHGDFWVLRITPEAGTVKTNEAREVVLHPQIVELGFPAFVEAAAAGHLFLKRGEDGDVLKPLQTLKNRLAEFGRSVVTDLGVKPNHGWRHRFKTVGREVRIDAQILDAIQGHAPRSVADSYGEVTLKTKFDAISKFPYIDLS